MTLVYLSPPAWPLASHPVASSTSLLLGSGGREVLGGGGAASTVRLVTGWCDGTMLPDALGESPGGDGRMAASG